MTFAPEVVREVDGVDVPYDFTGHAGTFEITRNGDVLLNGSVSLYAGLLVWKVPDETTDTWPTCEHRYRIRIEFPNGDRTTFFAGTFNIVKV
jgi:hypothetical protein